MSYGRPGDFDPSHRIGPGDDTLVGIPAIPRVGEFSPVPPPQHHEYVHPKWSRTKKTVASVIAVAALAEVSGTALFLADKHQGPQGSSAAPFESGSATPSASPSATKTQKKHTASPKASASASAKESTSASPHATVSHKPHAAPRSAAPTHKATASPTASHIPEFIWGCDTLDTGSAVNGDKGGFTATDACGGVLNLSPENISLAPGTPIQAVCETNGGQIGVEVAGREGVIDPSALYPQHTGHLALCSTVGFSYQ